METLWPVSKKNLSEEEVRSRQILLRDWLVTHTNFRDKLGRDFRVLYFLVSLRL